MPPSVLRPKSTCGICATPVKDGDQALQCDHCGAWEHIVCTKISVKLYEALMEDVTEHLYYKCVMCMKSLSTRLPCTNEIHVSKTNLNPSTRGMKRLSSQRDTTDDTDQEATASSKSGDDGNQKRRRKKKHLKGESNVDADTHTVVPLCDDPSEMERVESNQWIEVGNNKRNREREDGHSSVAGTRKRGGLPPQRDRCLMVFRMEESNENTPEGRYDDDISLLKSMVSKLLDEGDPGITVHRAIRLGKRDETGNRPRALQVVLENAQEVNRLLGRAYRLSSTPWFIRADLTREQRDQQKEAVSQLKERRKNGETNLIIRDFRVVRRKLARGPIKLQGGSPQLSS